MPDQPLRIAVIGGGIAGLATAYNLENAPANQHFRVNTDLFESADRVGGKLQTVSQDGYLIEAGPNGWLDNEPATDRLLAKLDLAESIQRSQDAARKRFLLIDGHLRQLPLSPPAFLKSDILSLAAKLRVAGELFIPPRKNLGLAATEPATDETVYDFGCRRLGKAFAETLLDPMVKGIFGGDARRLSLAAAFPRMVELERNYGGLFKAMAKLFRERRRNGNKKAATAGPGGVLHSLNKGMTLLPRTLRRALSASVYTGQSVTRVWREGNAWWLRTEQARHGPFNAVIDAAPAHSAAGHVDDPELADLLAGIKYAPMAVISLAYRRDKITHPLSGFGMLNPSREQCRLLGVLWSSSIFSGRAPANRVVLRCMAGGASNPELVELSDDSLLEICLKELGPLYGLEGSPEHAWIIRHQKAIAQYEPGHLARMVAIEESLQRNPGLFLTGSSYKGISVNHCLAEAEKTAAEVLAWLFHQAAVPNPRTADRLTFSGSATRETQA